MTSPFAVSLPYRAGRGAASFDKLRTNGVVGGVKTNGVVAGARTDGVVAAVRTHRAVGTLRSDGWWAEWARMGLAVCRGQ